MRKSWHSYFIELAQMVSDRATCERLKVGAVLVKDKRIIATGYNGSTAGDEHCTDVGCKVVDNHCIRTIHAEQNALFQCAQFGVSTKGATVYVTHFPCLLCSKSLIQAGIIELYYSIDYKNSEYAMNLLYDAGVVMKRVEVDGKLTPWIRKGKN